MAFIQIIEYRTSLPDKVNQLQDEYDRATEGKRTVRRSILTRDRTDPERYLAIVFFDSYESAMENSGLPETQAVAGRLASVVEGPPTFHDLDVIDDRS